MSNALLKIVNLNKSFGITRANININFELGKGEIRGLAGENGSGKSTLLSQIAGLYGSDSGKMYINGNEYLPKSPIEANEHKVAMVVQELGMIGALPASVNIYLGKTKKVVRLKELQKQADAVSDRWGLPRLNLGKMAGTMNIENRKMVELVRALSVEPDLLILDEVTQSLSHDNREIIYGLIKRFKEEGRSIILISHDLEETIRITDTISILRDGELLETVVSSEISEDVLKRKMVGRELKGDYYREDYEDQYEDEVVFSLRNISTATGIKDASVKLHKGEILAFCGLSDSGIHDIGMVAYGLMSTTSGEVVFDKKGITIKKPIQALKNKIAYVPKDRDGEALMMKTSIMHNFILPSIEVLKKGRLGYLDFAQLREFSENKRSDFRLKCMGINQNMNGLSGGNKQKVNLGRWLGKDLDILIVDCPTRGVDVGVKAYIYQCLRDAKKKGIGVIMITDELSEAIGMADNIVVMKNGEVKKTIKRSSHFNEEEIIEVMV